MATAKVQAAWIEIDPETLSGGQEVAYKLYKEAYRAMKASREQLELKASRQQFEQLMAEGVPAGERMIFGYNFGKLSVAIVPDDRKPAKASQPKQSLAEYLAARAQSGQRS